MHARKIAHFAAELAEEAGSARDRADVRQQAIAHLRPFLGFETVYWGEPFDADPDGDALCSTVSARAQGPLDDFASNRRRFDVPDAIHAIRAIGGVAIGHEVFTLADTDRLPLYTDVLRPAGIRSYIFCEITFRGRVQSTLTLSRHGRCRPFGARDKEIVRAVKATLGLVEAAYGGGASTASGTMAPAELMACHGLTAREAQVAAHVARGLGNKEIAHVLGTSPDTVRKQTIRIFA
jgi:DNA-binding NarL/FixJ family response regulator